MCIAAAGKVIEILENNIVLADVRGNKLRVNASLVDIMPGDFVLIHAGAAIQKITKTQAKEMDEILLELESMDLSE